MGQFPRLYPILDAGTLAAHGVSVLEFAEAMRAAGVELLQYRDKARGPQAVLRNAALIREAFAGAACRLILNDRADLAVLAGWDGVHVGQGDLSVADAEAVMRCTRSHPSQEREGWGTRTRSHPSQEREGWGTRTRSHPSQEREGWGTRFVVGVSTHTEAQVIAADAGCAGYVAIGPVFATGTKVDAEPVLGLEGVRRARALTTKPLVAIGGITRENALSVVGAGADSVAVISGLFAAGETVEWVARDFIELLR